MLPTGRDRPVGAAALGIAALAAALLLGWALLPAAAGAGQRATIGATAKGKNGTGHKRLRAVIRRTKYGVPHIKAHDIESLAAGYAYAFAEDNICTLADEYVTVAGKRSKYFGPDGTGLLRQRHDLQEPRRRLLLPVGRGAGHGRAS